MNSNDHKIDIPSSPPLNLRGGWVGICIFFVLLGSLVGCVKVGDNQKKRGKLAPIEVPGGVVVPYYGFSIDVSYDRRLDSIVPGYKLLNVAIRNTSPFVVPMNPIKDRWILVDSVGKKFQMVNSIRIKNPKLWRELPSELRHKMEYAENVPVSYEVTFNLLVPEKIDMEGFEEVHYYNAHWKRKFVITKY